MRVSCWIAAALLLASAAPALAEDAAAQLLASQSRWPEVVADATDGIGADSSRADLYLLRARARRMLGDPERAVADATKGLALGANAELLVERAWAHAVKGDWDSVATDA